MVFDPKKGVQNTPQKGGQKWPPKWVHFWTLQGGRPPLDHWDRKSVHCSWNLVKNSDFEQKCVAVAEIWGILEQKCVAVAEIWGILEQKYVTVAEILRF